MRDFLIATSAIRPYTHGATCPPCSTERTAFEKVVCVSVRTFYHIWYVIPYMIR